MGNNRFTITSLRDTLTQWTLTLYTGNEADERGALVVVHYRLGGARYTAAVPVDEVDLNPERVKGSGWEYSGALSSKSSFVFSCLRKRLHILLRRRLHA